ncbi:MAG: GNAT family N-acetyltransferase [Gemmatimonadota bacterium]|nr:GNAT family N-acetyltransferase [Gemmatimonadota bacterium]
MIKDSTALMTFFIGFVWSGAFLWPVLANGVDAGNMSRGLGYFLAAVLGAGIVSGLIGIETGNLLGGVWERYHREHRRAPVSSVASHNGVGPAPTFIAQSPRPGRFASGIDPARIHVTRDGVYAASYVELAERVRPDLLEVPRLREALSKTTNIGAWDGGRLVGAVRVLSDGYTFTALADIIVDPEYQALGVGRRLMAEALDTSAAGRLFVEARPECAGFFERVGCERRGAGFVMIKPAGRT